jgi:predicted metal-binding membrane protein
VRVHVGDGRDAHARRLDDVDDLDANARTDLGSAPLPSFLGMWVMMMASMMPSLVPMLWRYYHVAGGWARRGRPLTARGRGLFLRVDRAPVGCLSTRRRARGARDQRPAFARAVPIAVGVIVLIAGVLQFTAWKARQLACCRQTPDRAQTVSADASAAWRQGLRLGLHCCCCCAGLTAMLLVIGVMDLRAMAAVTAAITVERLAPAAERVARASGPSSRPGCFSSLAPSESDSATAYQRERKPARSCECRPAPGRR